MAYNDVDRPAMKVKKEQEIIDITRKIKDAIINKNVDAIMEVLAYPHLCGDVQLDKEKIQEDLLDSNSKLYVRLFDTNRYQIKYKNKVSLSDYFKEHDVSCNKIFFLDEDTSSFNVAEVYFTNYIDFIFVHEEGRWFLVEGLYDCP